MLKVSVIVNPNAGPARRRLSPQAAVELAERVIGGLGAEPRALVADGPGAGRTLAARELERGADVICAWGGDGTINEIAAAVSQGDGTLAIVPAGSGNGLARDLQVPLSPASALAVAVQGATRRIDVAEIDGRAFFNVAGLGFDAHIANAFDSAAGGRRGVLSYLLVGARELFRYSSATYDVEIDGVPLPRAPAMMVSAANSRQWGNRVQIAPGARLDDGLIDVVVVGETRPLVIAAHLWRLLAGSIDRAGGITTAPARVVRIAADRDVPLHVDGDRAGLVRSVEIRVRPGALRVRVPG